MILVEVAERPLALHKSARALTATVTAQGATSTLRMHLHYGGRLAGPIVERLLAEEIERSAPG